MSSTALVPTNACKVDGCINHRITGSARTAQAAPGELSFAHVHFEPLAQPEGDPEGDDFKPGHPSGMLFEVRVEHPPLAPGPPGLPPTKQAPEVYRFDDGEDAARVYLGYVRALGGDLEGEAKKLGWTVGRRGVLIAPEE